MTKIFQCSSNQKIPYEIGSYFYFNETIHNKSEKLNDIFGKQYAYLSTCRSAIRIILSQLSENNKVALLPAFTCHAVVEPFVNCGYSVEPYSIKKDFSVEPKRFLEDVERVNPSVILIHDYFGFDSNAALRQSVLFERLKERGIVAIIDRTQSMFSFYPQLEGHYVIGSLRKWMGIPDGAFVNLFIGELCEDLELVAAKRKAMTYKDSYIRQGIGKKETVLELYKSAEQILDSRNQVYAMSGVSKELFMDTDLDEMRVSRRKNYEKLANGIHYSENIHIPHLDLQDNEVPFYFPVFIKNSRADFQSYLARNSIYATVIWGCPKEYEGKIDMIAEEIYREILCIPCDQRYTQKDMDYICKIINKYLF